jgi:hypothetical protein
MAFARLTSSLPRRTWWLTVVLIGVVALVGCSAQDANAPRVTSLAIVNEQCTAGVCGLPRLTTAEIKVSGQGVCSFRLDLGNSRFIDLDDYDFRTGPRTFRFDFADGWPGPKTVTAFGKNGCLGRYSVLHHVFTTQTQEDWKIGWAKPTLLCYEVPTPSGSNFPPLRPGTRVHITAPTMPEVQFGTWVHYDPDGQPGSSAPPSFPFPGFRAYSLIVSVGSEIHQGGTNTTFTTVHGGDLLLCVNDDYLWDNQGGWQVNIFVDESQAP